LPSGLQLLRSVRRLSLGEALLESARTSTISFRPITMEKSNHWHRPLLCPCRQRPRRCRTAEKGDELAARCWKSDFTICHRPTPKRCRVARSLAGRLISRTYGKQPTCKIIEPMNLDPRLPCMNYTVHRPDFAASARDRFWPDCDTPRRSFFGRYRGRSGRWARPAQQRAP
jgi:hypothetical protein